MKPWSRALLLPALLGVHCGGSRLPGRPPPTAMIPADAAAPRAVSQPAQQTQPLLWRVERAGRSSYLFGTMHVGVSMEQALGVAGRAALTQARLVCVEVDMTDEQALQRSMIAAFQRAQLPPNESVRAMLTAAEWARVVAVLSSLPPERLERFEPWVVALLLLSQSAAPTVAPATRGDAGTARPTAQEAPREPMDVQLTRDARARGVRVVPLEAVRDQLDAMATLSRAHALTMLRSFARDPQGAGRAMGALATAYQGGDAEQAMLTVVRAMERELPEWSAVLLEQRNARWLTRLTPLLAEGGAFVAVGAAHMVGEKGLVAGLRERGYTVTRVRPPGE